MLRVHLADVTQPTTFAVIKIGFSRLHYSTVVNLVDSQIYSLNFRLGPETEHLLRGIFVNEGRNRLGRSTFRSGRVISKRAAKTYLNGVKAYKCGAACAH